MTSPAVPTFYLYGEPHRHVADGFIHVEALDDRSRPGGWTIRPHAHRALAQILLLTAGGGTMHADGPTFRVEAPALLVVPTGVAHGFDWQRESVGAVLTVAESYAADILKRDPGLAPLFATARVLPLDGSAAARAASRLATLQHELGWSAPGHRAAVEGALLSLFADAVRLVGSEGGSAAPAPARQAALVARYRARIDERFRMREPVAAHAAALGVSEGRLRAACATIAASSPASLIDQRAMLEARRALLYSGLSIAAIGYALGFADPAYFSRFFSRHERRSPREYRRSAGAEVG